MDTGNEKVVVQMSNVELYYMGQAFRLGRYAIHFHLNGELADSYVKSCAFHKSFNRFVLYAVFRNRNSRLNIIVDLKLKKQSLNMQYKFYKYIFS